MRSTARACLHATLDRFSCRRHRFGRVAGEWLLALVISLVGVGNASANRVTISANHYSVLVWIAQDLGYFRDEGLDVEIQLLESGVRGLEAVIQGQSDITAASDTAFVSRSFERPDLRILASIAAIEASPMIARADRSINTAHDLAGKRIGVTFRSATEYFLSRYFTINGIPQTEATIVDLGPEEIVKQILSGEIDAGLAWEPFSRVAALGLKGNYVILPNPFNEIYYFLLISTQKFLEANPDEIRSLLRALIKAENYSAENQEKAKEIIRKRFNMTTDAIDYTWPLHNLGVSLPQGLMFALEQQAAWHVEKKLNANVPIPNYLDAIVTDPLREIRETSVGIVK